ncbi:uncharacterized protein C5orf34 homolog isoform X2 [Octodon degus]|nr:uncharacterized protein C5orf34 homolog isoform X2 [Octodon degus]
MTSEARMVLYGDDTVQVQYANGSRLQLSPCGSEFLFEKSPPISEYPLKQPERIRQRTHFGISNYRRQLQCALDFRNLSATYPYLSESILSSERKKYLYVDISEVRWPSPEAYDSMISVEKDTGIVKITSLDGRAYLSVPKSQYEFAVHFLCKISQNERISSEINREAPKDKPGEKASKMSGSLPGQRLKNNKSEALCQISQSGEALEKISCATETKGTAEPPASSADHVRVHAWVTQCWPVALCPEEWKYPLSLALHFHKKLNNVPLIDPDITTSGILTSHISEERKEVSILPKALILSCPFPHLHRWKFRDTLLQVRADEKYSYPELVKMVWHRGVTYRLSHGNVSSIEIYPGDGSVLKSEGTYLGNYFTCYSYREGTTEREEKTYSVNNLPPDRPGSVFSIRTVIRRATRILQHCAKVKLSLSHNYHMCCWKMLPEMNGNNVLPLLVKESLISGLGRFLAYSDNKVHAVFVDGTSLTLNWDFTSPAEKRQVNRGLSLGWCKLTFPDGEDQLIQIEHPGPYKRYVTAVTSWCRGLPQTSPRDMVTHPSSSVPEEHWSVASELEKIQKFNLLLENSGVLNYTSSNKTEPSSDSSENLLESVNEKRVSVALKKISEILQDIDYLLSNSKK